MKKLVGMLAVLGVFALLVPAFAGEVGVGDKPLTRIQFGERIHGLDKKLVDRQYEEYRKGRIAAPTLNVSSMR